MGVVLFEIRDGKVWVSSLEIARLFERQHKDVLESVRNLETEPEFGRRNFSPSSYVNAQNKEMPMYMMTKKGYRRLVMDFTGKRASEVKEQLLDRFEELEEMEAAPKGNHAYPLVLHEKTAKTTGQPMHSNSFIFNVSRETYETHRKFGFCATGNSSEPLTSLKDVRNGNIPYKHYDIISNILNVRDGDLIFFYVEGVGFKGIYRAKHSPFFDPIEIEGVPASRPFRVQIECVHHFDAPVPENALFSSTDLQRTFWLWYHNKIRRSGRGCTPLDPDARDTLIELLIRYNGGEESEKTFRREQYPNANDIQEIRSLKVSYNQKDSSISYETALEAIMMNAFRDLRSSFAPIFGNFSNIEWFANQIPYHVSGKTIDMMLYHRSQEFLGIDTRFQYTVIELKRSIADIKTVKQLFEYCGWVGDHIAEGETHLVQPMIVAHSFDQAVLNLLQSDYQTVSPTFKPLKLVQYRYDQNSGLKLQDVLTEPLGLDNERYQKVRSQYLRKGKQTTKSSESLGIA